MDQRIIAVVFFERGSHGFDEPYNDQWTIEQWLEHFKKETIRANNAKFPVIFYLQRTVHNPDGSFKLDEKGDRVTETLYLNEKIISNLANV
jgi:hypothetical protein